MLLLKLVLSTTFFIVVVMFHFTSVIFPKYWHVYCWRLFYICMKLCKDLEDLNVNNWGWEAENVIFFLFGFRVDSPKSIGILYYYPVCKSKLFQPIDYRTNFLHVLHFKFVVFCLFTLQNRKYIFTNIFKYIYTE